MGDTDGNAPTTSNPSTGTYTPVEALHVLQVAGALASGYQAAPLVDPVVYSDIVGTGAISPVDALDVLIRAGGGTVAQLPAVPSTFTPLPGGPDPALQVGSASGDAGSTVLVPVTLDQGQGLDGVHLALSYDTSRLELAAVQLGSLTQGFTLSVNPNAQAGTVAVDETGSPVQGQGGGSVAVLVFQVKSDAPAGTAFVDLQQDLVPQGGSERTALFGRDALGQAFQYVLSPAPSDAAGSKDDGLVTVLR
jgi:Cohesin domain